MGAAFAWDETDGVLVLRVQSDRVRAAFTTRVGGVSRPPFDTLNVSFSRHAHDDPAARQENRRRAGATIGSTGAWSRVHQVHGAQVVEARDDVVDADALWTGDPARTVAVLGADCMQVVLVGSRRVAAAHAGWKGTLAGAIESAAKAVDASEGWVGPSIGPCCYHVDAERARAFASEFGRSVVGGGRLDLWTCAEIASARAGVKRLEVARVCTQCHPSLFYSFRRDGKPHGSQGAIARLPA